MKDILNSLDIFHNFLLQIRINFSKLIICLVIFARLLVTFLVSEFKDPECKVKLLEDIWQPKFYSGRGNCQIMPSLLLVVKMNGFKKDFRLPNRIFISNTERVFDTFLEVPHYRNNRMTLQQLGWNWLIRYYLS